MLRCQGKPTGKLRSVSAEARLDLAQLPHELVVLLAGEVLAGLAPVARLNAKLECRLGQHLLVRLVRLRRGSNQIVRVYQPNSTQTPPVQAIIHIKAPVRPKKKNRLTNFA